MIFIKCFKNSILLSGPNRTSESPSYLFSLVLGNECTILMCCIRLNFLPKDPWQISHWNLLILICFSLKCLLAPYKLANDLWHFGHGIWPSWFCFSSFHSIFSIGNPFLFSGFSIDLVQSKSHVLLQCCGTLANDFSMNICLWILYRKFCKWICCHLL